MSSTLLEYDELIEGVKGYNAGTCHACFFTSVQTDSRNVCDKSLFVPLVGEKQNGHIYIPQAIQKGASVIFVNKNTLNADRALYENLQKENPNVLFVAVENTLHALQDAAEVYASKKCSNMIRISITGSSGKTTTKEMMVSVCKAHFGEDGVAYTKGNFNSETGLPLTVFTIRGDEKVCVLEMGMNRENEIGEISKVFKSQYGIITNIGTAHIGILGSRENIAREKRKSFDYIPENGAAFVPETDSYCDFCTENVKGKVVKYGRTASEKNYNVRYGEDKGLFGTEFYIDDVKVNLSLSGDYNYINALGVISCAKEIGITDEEIKKGLERVEAVAGRMENKIVRLKNGKNVILIKDCYNANYESMSKVIEFCDGLKKIGKKIFVLADMKELGSESEKTHRMIGEKINEVSPDYVYLIGEEMKAAYSVLFKKENSFYYEQGGDYTFGIISGQINSYAEDNDVILLKGSHSMELEKLVPMLVNQEEQK
ncbi:MAG: UDP-N-acetylmuramoyl-tripeptide--D-alanyl-D-alanine ligase [Treponema sp.]|nr:UDP-N-acetylmuramoyl-tripeptide--D-alanyl-D-alanine ligase [Treponema sp.]